MPTTFSEPSLTAILRRIQSLIDSGEFSNLPETEQAYLLERMERAAPECAIERAIIAASDKQRRFMKAFFGRHDEEGRSCDVFVALGGNRSGKSFGTGWLCFSQWVRDHAKA